ncbi:MAG: MarR family transcriptional regulator [Lentisphaeria bacterium]|nr:MarR family transcriptional regulator [Lentisphaeria bacterium]
MKKTDAAILRQSIAKIHDLFRETATGLPGMPNIDISVRENRILSLICMITEEKPEGIALKELAAAMKLAPATVSELVDDLVNKDLLVRVQNPNDRRAIQISLSKYGRKLVDDSLRSIDDLCEKLLSGLSPAEQSALIGGLSKIADIS